MSVITVVAPTSLLRHQRASVEVRTNFARQLHQFGDIDGRLDQDKDVLEILGQHNHDPVSAAKAKSGAALINEENGLESDADVIKTILRTMQLSRL